MTRPLLSFVIPAYNEEAGIEACLRSVLRQVRASGCAAEVIVVDNASTDRTGAVAAAVPGVRVVREPQKGLLFARQRGFEEARGDLVACIDADSTLRPGWIPRAVRAFARSPRLVCLTGPYVYDGVSAVARIFVVLWYAAALLLLGFVTQYVLRTGSLVQGGNYVVRRSALARIGGYNTGIAFYGEDTDLACRLIRAGTVRFSFLFPLRTSGRRLRAEGVFATAVEYALNGLAVLMRGSPSTSRYTDIRERAESAPGA